MQKKFCNRPIYTFYIIMPSGDVLLRYCLRSLDGSRVRILTSSSLAPQTRLLL